MQQNVPGRNGGQVVKELAFHNGIDVYVLDGPGENCLHGSTVTILCKPINQHSNLCKPLQAHQPQQAHQPPLKPPQVHQPVLKPTQAYK